jgi:hypothetical protein
MLAQIQEQAALNESTAQTDIDREIKAENKRLAGLRRQIRRVTDAIAESGHSRALLDKLAVLEVEEAEIMARLVQIDRQKLVQAPSMSIQELGELSKNLMSQLYDADPASARQVLRGLIERISVERDGKELHGFMTCYFPPEAHNKAPPEDITASISLPSLGVPVRRHIFSVPLSAKIIRPYVRKKPPS